MKCSTKDTIPHWHIDIKNILKIPFEKGGPLMSTNLWWGLSEDSFLKGGSTHDIFVIPSLQVCRFCAQQLPRGRSKEVVPPDALPTSTDRAVALQAQKDGDDRSPRLGQKHLAGANPGSNRSWAPGNVQPHVAEAWLFLAGYFLFLGSPEVSEYDL